MTKTYNRFHDTYETDSKYRRVARTPCRPWIALSSTPTAGPTSSTDCEFLLDHEIDEASLGSQAEALPVPLARSRLRDEVLARLLALNAERAQDEERTPGGMPDVAAWRRGRTQFDRALTPISMNSDASGES